MSPVPIRRKSKRWQRDRMGEAVCWILRASVVAKQKMTLGGGSSRIFSSAFHASPRQHVRLVEDVDLVALLLRRRIHGPLPQFTRVVHAPVGGRVDFDHVQRGVSGPDACAVLALPARLPFGGAARAVERHGQDPGHRRLADPPGTAQQVRVPDTVSRDGAFQRLGNVLLRLHLAEAAGPILPGQGEVGQRVVTGAAVVGLNRGARCPRHSAATVTSLYRCYLQGPDGVHGLPPRGPGAPAKLPGRGRGRQRASPTAGCHHCPGRQASGMCSISCAGPLIRTATASNR